MKNRSSNYYRHHRNRVIQRKSKIIKEVWGNTTHPWIKNPGKLSKAKLNCSCGMCKYEKDNDIPKAKHKGKLKSMKQDINDYFAQ